ncbi:HAMP domain-containing sensor histidine kinase [Ramlibacter sp. AN1015]|uniref:sensor histidine kinase n=1 Tax=Ramlibacter sp. AN1015 TaxID=3133428 RepID=UPI0030C3300F
MSAGGPARPHDAQALAAELREAQRALAEARAGLHARDEFLAIAAHELRSPLNALGLQLALLERSAAETDPALREQVQRARRNAQRCVRRATVLLDLSRIATGQLRPTFGTVSLSQVVREVVETYQDEAAFRGAELSEAVEVDAVGCWDAQMVEEIIGNLVANAIRYGAGTAVRVHAGAGPADWAWVRVQDGGPGIPPADLARMSQTFERVVAGAADRGGFGLGLWIAGTMAAAHAGTIEVASQPGAGSTFTIRLPLRVAAAGVKDQHT